MRESRKHEAEVAAQRAAEEAGEAARAEKTAAAIADLQRLTQAVEEAIRSSPQDRSQLKNFHSQLDSTIKRVSQEGRVVQDAQEKLKRLKEILLPGDVLVGELKSTRNPSDVNKLLGRLNTEKLLQCVSRDSCAGMTTRPCNPENLLRTILENDELSHPGKAEVIKMLDGHLAQSGIHQYLAHNPKALVLAAAKGSLDGVKALKHLGARYARAAEDKASIKGHSEVKRFLEGWHKEDEARTAERMALEKAEREANAEKEKAEKSKAVVNDVVNYLVERAWERVEAARKKEEKKEAKKEAKEAYETAMAAEHGLSVVDWRKMEALKEARAILARHSDSVEAAAQEMTKLQLQEYIQQFNESGWTTKGARTKKELETRLCLMVSQEANLRDSRKRPHEETASSQAVELPQAVEIPHSVEHQSVGGGGDSIVTSAFSNRSRCTSPGPAMCGHSQPDSCATTPHAPNRHAHVQAQAQVQRGSSRPASCAPTPPLSRVNISQPSTVAVRSSHSPAQLRDANVSQKQRTLNWPSTSAHNDHAQARSPLRSGHDQGGNREDRGRGDGSRSGPYGGGSDMHGGRDRHNSRRRRDGGAGGYDGGRSGGGRYGGDCYDDRRGGGGRYDDRYDRDRYGGGRYDERYDERYDRDRYDERPRYDKRPRYDDRGPWYDDDRRRGGYDGNRPRGSR